MKYKIHNNIRLIVAFNLVGFSLLFTYCWPKTTAFWDAIDTWVFRFFNNELIEGSLFLALTAYTNLRVFDVVAFVAMGALYAYYFARQDAPGRKRMVAIGITMLLCAIAIKQMGRFLPIEHPSPTLFFDDAIRLSMLTSIGAKDASGNSFPGDHGMMLMIFAAFMARYHGRWAFALASLFLVVFSMPRLMSGAHWFSDVYIGSLAIVCISMSWFLLTPASDFATRAVERFLPSEIKVGKRVFMPFSKPIGEDERL